MKKLTKKTKIGLIVGTCLIAVTGLIIGLTFGLKSKSAPANINRFHIEYGTPEYQTWHNSCFNFGCELPRI